MGEQIRRGIKAIESMTSDELAAEAIIALDRAHENWYIEPRARDLFLNKGAIYAGLAAYKAVKEAGEFPPGMSEPMSS